MAIADKYFTFYQAVKEKVGEAADKTAAKLSQCYPSTSTSTTFETAASIVDTAMDDLVFGLTEELSRLTAGTYSAVEPVQSHPHQSPPEEVKKERPEVTQTRSGRISKRPNNTLWYTVSESSSSSLESLLLSQSLSPSSSPKSPRRQPITHKSPKRLQWRGSIKRFSAGRHKSAASKKRCICPQCGCSFANASSLKSHEKRLHATGQVPIFRCRWPSCTANFSSRYRNNAIIHVRTMHLGVPPESNGCPKREMAKSYVVKV